MSLNPYDDTLDQVAKTPTPAAPVNPYAETLRLRDQTTTTETARTLSQAEPIAPDAQAEALALSRKLGLPPDLIRRNLPAMRQRAKVAETDYGAIVRETPKLAATLTAQPDVAPVVQDDLDPLGFLHWLLDAPGRALIQGQAQVTYGRLMSDSLTRTLTADERTQLAEAREAMQAGGDLGADTWFKGAITGAFRQLPNWWGAGLAGFPYAASGGVAAGSAVALLSAAGGPVGETIGVGSAFAGGFAAGMLTGGAKFAFQLESGLAYDEYQNFKDELGRPIDPTVAKAAALATGALNAGLEVIGLEKLAESIPGVRQLSGKAARASVKTLLRNPTIRQALFDAVKSYGGTLTAETAVEVAQRAVTILSGEFGKIASGATSQLGSPAGVANIGADLVGEAAGAIQSFALGLAPGPAMAFSLDVARARQAQHNVAFFQSLAEGVQQSKTVQRSPDVAQAILAAATKDGPLEHVYAPIDTWTQYWQSHDVDPAEMAAEVTGDPEAYERAIRTGERLEIPTARYAVKLAGTEHNVFFQRELAPGPDEMNTREAIAFVEAVKKRAAEAAEATGAEEIGARVREQLLAAGADAATAEKQAALHEAVFGTVAERLGVTPEQFFARAGATAIERAVLGEGGTATFQQVDTAAPAFQAWFGKSMMVDRDGQPIVAYHGTARDFDTFSVEAAGSGRGNADERALFFSVTPDTANHSAQVMGAENLTDDEFERAIETGQWMSRGDVVYPVHLKVENPYVSDLTTYTPQAMVEELEKARAAGHDGVLFPRLGGVGESGTVAVFKPEQVKSAIGNRGTFDPNDPNFLHQSLFHGTPHAVDRFSTDKIGTGEGALSFGWGLYFAENKETAEHYRDSLGRTAFVIDGKPVELKPGSLELSAFRLVQDLGSVDAALDRVKAMQEEIPMTRAAVRAYRQALESLRGKTVEERPTGSLYEIEIPDDQVANMLDWDATYDEQPASVKAALRELWIERRGNPDAERPFAARASATGEQIYAAVATAFSASLDSESETMRAGSEALARVGVPGLRYLDAGSRGAKDGTRNVVVFDDSIITITHKDGSPVSAKERAEFLQEQASGQPRGSFDPTTRTIYLFEKANLSTFLHESGHLFLEALAQAASEVAAIPDETRTATQRQLAADMDAILGWVGFDGGLDAWRALTPDERREHHEQFARAFEAYLMEGKAPSVALQGAFSRFRAWLLGIYRTALSLNVTLTPEVRGVFDRMLASDRAIEEAEAVGRFDAIFTDARSAGMTEERFAGYRETVAQASAAARAKLDADLMAEVQREREQQWKDARAATRQQVEAEIRERPVYQAVAAIRTGTKPDGSPLVDGVEPTPWKLSKAILVQRYGAERLKALPKPYLYTTQGGADPDVVADQFGFSSGDELLSAIVAAGPLNAAVEAETERRMIAEHGSLLLDGSIYERAQEAAANDRRDAVIRAEIRALADLQRRSQPVVDAALAEAEHERDYERRWFEAEAKLRIAIAEGHQQVEIDALRAEVRDLRAKSRSGPTAIRTALPPAKAVQAAAEARIAGTRVRDLRPATFWSAAARAAQQAVEAAARQDFGAAVEAKVQQLLNLALYREATRAIADVEARVKRARALGNGPARERLGKAGPSYLEQVDGILARFEFARVPLKTLDRRASLRKWVESLEADGLPVDLPEDVLDDALQVNYLELTVERLVGITDGLQQIVHLARLKNRLLKAQDQRNLAEAVTALQESIVAHSKRSPRKVLETRLPQDEGARAASVAFAAHRKLNNFIQQLDGWEDGGLAWEYIVRPINQAANAEAEMNVAAARSLVDLFAAYHGEESSLYAKQFIPAIGASLSKMSRLMVALHWGNEYGRDRLVSDRKRRWTRDQVLAILDTLDARDVAFVNSTWKLFDSYWDEIAAKEQRVTGVAPERVEALPFSARGGDFTGGYAPKMYEGRLSAKAQSDIDAGFADSLKRASYVASTTKRNHTKQSVEHYTEPLRLDFNIISEHLTQVVHDLTHHEMLIDVTRLLGNRQIQDAIYDHHGDVVYDQLKGIVHDIAVGNAPAPSWMRPMNALRQGVVVARLAWSVVVSALQPFQSMMAIPHFGGGLEGTAWLLRGYAKWTRDAASFQNTARWIRDRSSFMRTRGLTQIREINEIRNRIGLDRGRVSGWIHDGLAALHVPPALMPAIADSYFYVIQKAQQLADIPVWLSAYQKAMSDPANDENRAVEIADQAVIDTQGSGQIKDLSAVERQSALKFLTTFYSFQNILLQSAVKSVKRTDLRSPSALSRLAMDAFVLLFAQQLIETAVRSALGRGGDDDDDKTIVERLVRAGVSEFAGMFIGARELSGVAEGYPYNGPAGFQWVSDLGRLGQQAAQMEPDAAFWRSLNTAAGDVLHYPASQVQRTVEGLMAIMDGRTANPLALVKGPPRDER